MLKNPDMSCGDFYRSTSYVNKTAGRSSPKKSDRGPRSCTNRLKRLNRSHLSCRGSSNFPDPIVPSAKKKIWTPSLWNILGMNRGSLKSSNIPFFSKHQSWSNLGSSMHALRACVFPILILVDACIFHPKFLAHANLNTYKTNKPWKKTFIEATIMWLVQKNTKPIRVLGCYDLHLPPNRNHVECSQIQLVWIGSVDVKLYKSKYNRSGYKQIHVTKIWAGSERK
jgi:hypothetical protein